MSQQINLINPALIKEKDFFTAANIGWTYLLLLALMAGYGAFITSELSGLRAERDQLSIESQQLVEKLSRESAARIPREPNPALQQEIERLEEKIHVQNKIAEMIKHGQSAPQRGISAYMRGFSRQAMDNLWLTGFDLNNTDQAVTINGRSFEAETLPKYIERLSQEPVFAGQTFGGLNMQQPIKSTLAKPNQGGGDAAKNAVDATPTLPEFIEFELRAVEKSADSVNNLKTAETRS